LTGRLPFDGPLGRTASDRIEPSGAGAGLDRVITSALAIRPDDRPPTAQALADALASGDAGPGRIPAWLVAVLMLVGFTSAAVATWYLR